MSTQAATVATFTGLASGIDTDAIISKMQQFAQQQISQLTTVSQGLNSQLTAYQSFNTTLAGLQTAATSISSPSTFLSNTATSSNTSVASITASAGALNGTHTLTVNSLAQAQEIVSNAYSNSNLGLNETGTFTINGHAVNVTASDSLNSLATKINSAAAGVTAAVVATGPNQYQLTVTANKSGVAQTISAVDTSGSVLGDVGLLTGSSTIRQAVGTNGAASITTTSGTATLDSLFGYSSGAGPSGTVTIGNGNGSSATINIDYNSDSLSSIAGKINAAGITGITASIVSLPDANGNAGGGGQQLVITNSAGTAPVLTDDNNVLASLGFLQRTTGTDSNGLNHQPLAAQDANFTYDGLTYTRSSNTIGDLVPGATVNLLSQTPTSGSNITPATTTLTIAQDTGSIVTAIQNFATAYNNVIQYISTQNTFTPPTGDTTGTEDQSPPLFGSSVLAQVQEQLSNALGAVSGGTTLGSIGVTLDPTSGNLVVNTGLLTTALQNNTTNVQSLFGIIGKTSNSNVQFVSAGSGTKPSSGAGYAVNVTVPGTQSTATATVAQTSASTEAETLTFGGTLFPNQVSLTLNSGNTLQDTVNQINGDSLLNGEVTASINSNGQLVISSVAYGSNTGFNVSSNLAGSSSTSGIGAAASYGGGTDVQGTINGEPATGLGQTLTGLPSNKNTAGLVLTVTASTAGSYGDVSITQGIGNQLNSLLTSILNPSTGSIASAESSLNTQISDNEKQITSINSQVSTEQSTLQQMFATMETQISQLQSQGQAFAAQAASLSGGSSSSSSSSSL